MSSRRNLAVAGGLVALVVGGMGFPFYYMKSSRNLYKQGDALTGSQQIRGAYINTGSRDAGRDPDWDPETNTYKGRSSLHQATAK